MEDNHNLLAPASPELGTAQPQLVQTPAAQFRVLDPVSGKILISRQNSCHYLALEHVVKYLPAGQPSKSERCFNLNIRKLKILAPVH